MIKLFLKNKSIILPFVDLKRTVGLQFFNFNFSKWTSFRTSENVKRENRFRMDGKLKIPRATPETNRTCGRVLDNSYRLNIRFKWCK